MRQDQCARKNDIGSHEIWGVRQEQPSKATEVAVLYSRTNMSDAAAKITSMREYRLIDVPLSYFTMFVQASKLSKFGG